MPDHVPDVTIDDLIATALLELEENGDPANERYAATLKTLETLYRIKRDNDAPDKRPKVDPNQVIAAASSLGGIAAILSFERVGIIATKAIGFVTKVRLPI